MKRFMVLKLGQTILNIIVFGGLFYQGNHIVVAGSKNTWKSKSAASSGLRLLVDDYLHNKKIISYYRNYLDSKEIDTVKKMLLEKGIIEIKEIK